MSLRNSADSEACGAPRIEGEAERIAYAFLDSSFHFSRGEVRPELIWPMIHLMTERVRSEFRPDGDK